MSGFSNGTVGDAIPDQRSMTAYFDQIDTLTIQPENEVEFSQGNVHCFSPYVDLLE